MSLVGPRPEQPSEVVLWTPELFDRLRARPGITGVWQVNGRSDARHAKDRLDLYYVDNWSITHDLAILLRTIPVVLSRKGAY
jgi:lipopolysaccharide/colanic/teichoic acid biosynthesis glycosyltransferase